MAPDASREKGKVRENSHYSRKEMEAMRSWGAAEQRRRWDKVYTELEEVTAREYDGLRADSVRKKNKRRGKKNEATALPVVSKDVAANTSENSDVLIFSKISCDDSIVGNRKDSAIEERCLDCECGNNIDGSGKDEPDSIQEPAFSVEQNFELGGSFLEPKNRMSVAAGEKGEDKGKLSRRCYSRKEMETMRSWDVDEHRQRWKEVYEGLGEVIAQEYDGLCTTNTQNQKHDKKKKEAKALPVANEEAAVGTPESSDPLGCRGIACDDANVVSQNGQAVEEWCCEYECSNNEDDSSDDEPDNVQRPAFLVDGEPDFDSGPPLDGLEYLRRVRWEAAQIPKVKVAKLKSTKQGSEQTPYMPKIPEIEECPIKLLPSKLWQDTFLAEFSELRQAFSQLEESCGQLSTIYHNGNSCKDSDCKQDPKSYPAMACLRGMDAVSRASTLRNYISMFESASELSRDDCLWLFALSVVVDTPLNADMSASMRCLLRKASSLLARKAEPDDEVAMLNILIAISGNYFGQSEKQKENKGQVQV
ncbi:hypothetical protein Cni_G18096 [Canna indica]|uniref:Gem-associated protein 2 n=1 Tax=Canna indica TaxID=4628 RepID=A0AAQ3QHD3_9LILI|nr:hypothetical protein Cni_G18096 [Canna indica]